MEMDGKITSKEILETILKKYKVSDSNS